RAAVPASVSSTVRPPPRAALFPYTTLFRSPRRARSRPADAARRGGGRVLAALPAARRRLDIRARDPSRRREMVSHGEGGISPRLDRKSTRLNSSHVAISYAVFCLKKKKDR